MLEDILFKIKRLYGVKSANKETIYNCKQTNILTKYKKSTYTHVYAFM